MEIGISSARAEFCFGASWDFIRGFTNASYFIIVHPRSRRRFVILKFAFCNLRSLRPRSSDIAGTAQTAMMPPYARGGGLALDGETAQLCSLSVELGHDRARRRCDLPRHLVTVRQVVARALEVEVEVARHVDDLIGVAMLRRQQRVRGGEHGHWRRHGPLWVVARAGPLSGQGRTPRRASPGAARAPARTRPSRRTAPTMCSAWRAAPLTRGPAARPAFESASQISDFRFLQASQVEREGGGG